MPTSGHENPPPQRLRNAGWGNHRKRLYFGRRFAGNPKAMRAWMRLTHQGWRINGVCVWCGAQVTLDEQIELDALYAAYPHSDDFYGGTLLRRQFSESNPLK